MIDKRLQKLRQLMEAQQLHYYVVPTYDAHLSEYVDDYYKTRTYMSGFTGSAGTLIVGREMAGLWTDGRYYTQARNQLAGSGITLFCDGNPGVITVEKFLELEIKTGENIGFDGRMMPADEGSRYQSIAEKAGGCLQADLDLVGEIWEDRPELISKPAYELAGQYNGQSASDKLGNVRVQMQSEGADVHLLSSLDDIAWLFNIRGNDVANNPVVCAHALIETEQVQLFIDEEKLKPELIRQFKSINIAIKPYGGIYPAVRNLSPSQTLLLDLRQINYALLQCIPEGVIQKACSNPTRMLKAIKNPVEINNLRQSHLLDGLAFTRFMYWLKQNIGRESMTEYSAQEQLEAFRKANPVYLEPSFGTICAYKANAAMMHYSANAQDCAEILPEGLLLIDSGGQYFEGTTDITRTLAMGPVSEEQRKHCTAVVKGMFNLSEARFLYGCNGQSLDILARGPVWEMNLDYRCGTGHGVGYFLNVHEGPNGFRWKLSPQTAVLEAGMVTTDEPGIYIEGSHGIRIENELLCVKGEENEYGQYMFFETLTLAPIDLDILWPADLSPIDRQRINHYHQLVYETLAPHLNSEEAQWLKTATQAI